MINVKRLTLISLCMASPCIGSMTLQAQETAAGTQQQNSAQPLPAQWDLQTCIDYALQQNITIRKNRLNAESAEVDVKTAKAALFPSLTASVSQRIVNRPNSETNTIINGDNITSSQSKTSYNGSYGIYSLAKDQVISIGDTNVCEIKNGEVKMIEADCPDHLCLKQRAVDSTGGTIVCLPNKIVIEGIKGTSSDEASPEFDTVV